MADELQSLLERIQQDGVNKAEVEAAKIIEAAMGKAASIVADGEKQVAAMRHKADEDARQLAKRGEAALQQAARDVILIVQEAIFKMFQSLADRQTIAALTPQVMAQLLGEVVRAYFNTPGGQRTIELLVPAAQAEQITAQLTASFREAMQAGVTIHADPGLSAGFAVRLVGDKVQHDFSRETIADAIARLVRPQLAAIIRKAMESAPASRP